MKVGADISYQKVFDAVNDALQSEATDALQLRLSPVDIYQRDDDPSHKQVTLRLTVASYKKTMTDAEVNGAHERVVQNLKQTLQATIRES